MSFTTPKKKKGKEGKKQNTKARKMENKKQKHIDIFCWTYTTLALIDNLGNLS